MFKGNAPLDRFNLFKKIKLTNEHMEFLGEMWIRVCEDGFTRGQIYNIFGEVVFRVHTGLNKLLWITDVLSSKMYPLTDEYGGWYIGTVPPERYMTRGHPSRLIDIWEIDEIRILDSWLKQRLLTRLSELEEVYF